MDNLEEIADRLRALEAELSRVTARVDALECRPGVATLDRPLVRSPDDSASAAGSTQSGHPPVPLAVTSRARMDLGGNLSLTGRTFIVFGGAFLLRALTESSRVPARLGVLLGLSYAVAWLIAADRAAHHGRGGSALFHGITGVLVGLPLIWEASTTFGVLNASGCATALGVMTTMTLLVADRQRLRTLAAVGIGGALCIAVPLAVMMNGFLPFAVLLIVLVAIALGVGAHRSWPWLVWPAALVADAFLFVVTARVRSPEPPATAAIAIALDLALLLVTIGYLIARAAGPARRLTIFEMAQSVTAVALGLGGALWLGRTAGVAPATVGGITLTVAMLAYLAVVRVLAPRGRTARTTQFFATMGLVLVLAGTSAMLAGAALTLLLATLALAAAGCGRRYGSSTATLHGFVYAIAALVAAGWTSRVITAWAGAPEVWPPLDTALATTLVTAWVCLFLRPAAAASRLMAVVGVGYAVVSVLVTSAAFLTLLGPVVAGSPADAGILATLRTAMLTIGVIGAAACSRVSALREFSTLVYPVLLCGGLKLVVEDFGHSRPATLFLALALYGIGLLVAPRLARD